MQRPPEVRQRTATQIIPHRTLAAEGHCKFGATARSPDDPTMRKNPFHNIYHIAIFRVNARPKAATDHRRRHRRIDDGEERNPHSCCNAFSAIGHPPRVSHALGGAPPGEEGELAAEFFGGRSWEKPPAPAGTTGADS